MAVNILSRADAAADVAAQNASLILRGVATKSISMQLMAQIPMTRRQERIRVESALPLAYWVNGDTGTKQTTKGAWADKLVVAEEIATIVPIPINVLRDSDMDLMAYIQPRCEEAIGRTLDAATLFGVNKPASFPAGLVPSAITATNTVLAGTATQAEGGIATDLSNVFAEVEAPGYDVDGVAAARSLRPLLRNARTTQGVRLDEFGANGVSEILGNPVAYGARGLWPTGGAAGTNPIALVGDFSQAILGVRQDIEVKVLTEAVIQDPSDGTIAYNLAQQDMIGLRFTARFGFQTSNYVTWESTTGTPFAALVQ